MKNAILRGIFTILVLQIMFVGFSENTIYANDTVHTMPEFENRKASMTITCDYYDEDKTTHIDGVTFEIYRVSDVTNTFGSISYVLLDKYKHLNISFDGMTASESNEYAKSLAQETNGADSKKGTTDSTGKAYFSDLDFGIYLVKQTGRVGTALNYTYYEPFLVIVPGISEDFTWINDVEVCPKPTTIFVEPVVDAAYEETKEAGDPDTGDESKIELWILLIQISILGIICILLRKSICSGKLTFIDTRTEEKETNR